MLDKNEMSGWKPETLLDCVDETDRTACLLVGIKNMIISTLEDAPAKLTGEDLLVWQAYSAILYREMDYAVNQLRQISETLYSEIKRRSRISEAIGKRRYRLKTQTDRSF